MKHAFMQSCTDCLYMYFIRGSSIHREAELASVMRSCGEDAMMAAKTIIDNRRNRYHILSTAGTIDHVVDHQPPELRSEKEACTIRLRLHTCIFEPEHSHMLSLACRTSSSPVVKIVWDMGRVSGSDKAPNLSRARLKRLGRDLKRARGTIMQQMNPE